MRKLLACFLVCMLLCPMASASVETENTSAGLIYEIFVGSFADSNGDGVGDLKGIEMRLDYIAALGAEYIWLTPIHPSPSYHHYDVTDYYAVDPVFGTMEDFDRLVAACDQRRIKVILDLVVNHTGKDHPWFQAAVQAIENGQESPYIRWYHFSENEGQHLVPGSDCWYYEGAFGDHMPDLNLANEEVRREISAILAFWQGHGVKGFRLDAITSYFSSDAAAGTECLRFITQTAKANDPDCFVVGEVWAAENVILDFYQSGVDSLFNFPASAAEGVLVKTASKATGARCAAQLAAWNQKIKAIAPAAVDTPFLTNHDQARSRGMLRSDEKRMKAAAMLYLLLPGRPVIYYGEEIGMSGSGRDENKRLPMLWNGAEPAQNCAPPAEADQEQRLTDGVEQQMKNADSLLRWYLDLAALRALAPELIHGEMTALNTGNDVLCAFTVREGESTVAVLINPSLKEEQALDAAALGIADWQMIGNINADSASVPSVLPPLSCVLLKNCQQTNAF